jgi:hypothetical protein
MAEHTIHQDTNGDIWVVVEDQPSVMKQLFPERPAPGIISVIWLANTSPRFWTKRALLR